MSTENAGLLDPRTTALLLVDVQERFRPVIAGFDSMVKGCVKLVRAFRILELPVLVTEQYPQGLGRTVPELREALGDPPVPEKTAFSSLGCSAVPEGLQKSGVRTVVVCGIETHVCVHQSVQDLLAAGYAVQIAIDAIESRRPVDRETGLRRMEQAGAALTTSEMVAFELVRDARHPKFREVQALFREK